MPDLPHPGAAVRPRRTITGMSAILLPFTDGGDVDWAGFAAHVEEELMAAASTAGCDEVLARSVFFRRFPDLAN